MMATLTRRTTLRYVSFCLLWAVAAVVLAQSVTLRLNLPAGKKYTFVSTNKIQQSTPGRQGAQGMSLDMTQTITMDLTVLSKSAQGTKVKTTISDVKITVPANSPMASQVQAMQNMAKGVSYEATYDARGRAVNSPSATAASPMAQQVMSSMSAAGMGILGFEFPMGPVSVGSKWTVPFDAGKLLGAMGQGLVKAGANSKIPISYRIVRFEQRGGKTLAHVGIALEGSLDLNVGGAQSGQQAMPMKLTFDMSGTVVLDTTTGLPVQSDTSGMNTITFGGMTMNQKMTATMRAK